MNEWMNFNSCLKHRVTPGRKEWMNELQQLSGTQGNARKEGMNELQQLSETQGNARKEWRNEWTSTGAAPTVTTAQSQSAANWRNTHTHMGRTHSLTHFHQHSYNHVVRSASSAITCRCMLWGLVFYDRWIWDLYRVHKFGWVPCIQREVRQ